MILRLLLVGMLPLLALADGGPKVIYTKSFPGSQPPFISITVEKSGRMEYKEDPADTNPQVVQLTPAEVDEVFALADKLDHFKRQIESGLKVARMGDKTFRYEDGATVQEAKFNYSTDPDAKQLHDWFERVSETEQAYQNLERTMKFDKLGVNQALLQFQVAIERKRIVGAQQFLPLLDRVAKNQTYMHMARERAEQLAASIRNPQAAAAKSENP